MSKVKTKWGKLPKAFKTKWVKALRSGKYEQGTGSLYEAKLDDTGVQHDTYCCLGVACLISGHTTKKLVAQGTITKDKRGWKVPKMLIGYANTDTLISKLADMNDGSVARKQSRRSFKQIATWIEKNL